MAKKASAQPLENAQEIIERFGGIRPMAKRLGVSPSTVQGWNERNIIPGKRKKDIIEAAQSDKIELGDVLKSVANENVKAEAKPTASQTKASPAKTSTAKTTQTKAAPPLRATRTTTAKATQTKTTAKATPKTAAKAKAQTLDEELILEKIKQSRQASFWSAVIVSLIFVFLIITLIATVMWPDIRASLQKDTAQIESTMSEKQLAALKEEPQSGFFSQTVPDLRIPDELRAQLAELKENDRTLQDTVSSLSSQLDEARKSAQDAAQKAIEDADLKSMVPDVDVGQVARRVEQLEEQLAPMLESIPSLTSVYDRVSLLRQSEGGQRTLNQAMLALQETLTGTAIEPENAAEKQAALEAARNDNDALGIALAGVPSEDLQAASMLLALTQFRESLNRETPFEDDLDVLINLVDNENTALQDSLIRLAPHAKNGVLTSEGLSNEFRGLAGEIVVASLQGEDVALSERAAARMNTVFSVEKEGELITGTETQVVVNRAQKMLDDGNIDGAVTELQKLQGPAAVKAEPWITKAQATMVARDVKAEIRQFLSRATMPTAPYTIN